MRRKYLTFQSAMGLVKMTGNPLTTLIHLFASQESMKHDPLRQTVLLFHIACGGLEDDGFAPYQLPTGETLRWCMKPFSLTQLAALELDLLGGRRTVDLRPDRELAIRPFLRCFGPKILDADVLRAALHILRDPRIQRQAIRYYSPPFALGMEDAARAIALRLGIRRRRSPQSVPRAAAPRRRQAPKNNPPPPRTKSS